MDCHERPSKRPAPRPSPARPLTRALATALALFAAYSLCAKSVAAAPDSPGPPPSSYGPVNTASVSFFSFFGPGVTLEYERYALPPAVSLASAIGFRATGGDDYSTLTLTTSLEAHLWLANIGPWRSKDRRMTGPLLALREDVAFTLVDNDRRGRLAGTAVEFAETLSLGYRLSLWRLHATPLLGGTVTTQLDPRGRLAPLTFLSGKLALTLGVMF